MSDNFQKCVELGILDNVKQGVALTPKYQKLIWNEFKKDLKIWHKEGRKDNIGLFNATERVIQKQFPKLDPLLEIEIEYYVSEIARLSLESHLTKQENNKC